MKLDFRACRNCNIDISVVLCYNPKLKLIIIFNLGESFMAEKTTYKTRQRDEILRFFTEHKDRCFSARDLIGQVDAGEATVFRALSTLTNEGKLKKFTGGSGESAYYQFNAAECALHIHLKCRECGKLIHMDCAFMEEILKHFRNEHAFTVDCGQTVIYGLCGDCTGTAAASSAECEHHPHPKEVHHE